MVEAYMDESGIHDGAHVCAVAGFWGGEGQWRRFEVRWEKIIKAEGLKEFHAREFWNASGERKGVFATWDDTKAVNFISDLVDCIQGYRIFPTCSAIKMSAWERLSKEERIFLTGGRYDPVTKEWARRGAPNRVYFLPFQFAVLPPALKCKPGLKVQYIFDLNKQFKTHAAEVFDLLKNDPNLSCRGRLGEFLMKPGKNVAGLQAADLLAFQAYQFNKQRVLQSVPPKLSEMPPMLQKLLKKADSTDFPFFDERGLEMALADMPPELRNKTS